MNRRRIFRKAAAGAGVFGHNNEASAARSEVGEVVVEKKAAGKPHSEKVFAAIQAHMDDIPYFCGGTCAKLIKEGYTGYLIRTSNDEKCGGGTVAENIHSNEQENLKMAKALGFKDVLDFYYRNHRMDGISPVEIRGRLILIFRALKVDTVLTFNPWGDGEENPDHWVTGKAVEAACWMAGMNQDFPEQCDAGFEPHSVKERYYFVARPGQPFNRVVDIGSTIESKISAIAECKSQGGGNRGADLKAQLRIDGKKLAILGDNDLTANREYIRNFLLDEYKELGAKYGITYAEPFFYIDQRSKGNSKVDEFIKKNAVTI